MRLLVVQITPSITTFFWGRMNYNAMPLKKNMGQLLKSPVYAVKLHGMNKRHKRFILIVLFLHIFHVHPNIFSSSLSDQIATFSLLNAPENPTFCMCWAQGGRVKKSEISWKSSSKRDTIFSDQPRYCSCGSCCPHHSFKIPATLQVFEELFIRPGHSALGPCTAFFARYFA